MKEETPSTLGVIIETPGGCVAYTGNLKLRNKNGVVSKEEETLFEIFKEKKTVLSLSNSANAERAGFALSDEEITKSIVQMLQEAPSVSFCRCFPRR